MVIGGEYNFLMSGGILVPGCIKVLFFLLNNQVS